MMRAFALVAGLLAALVVTAVQPAFAFGEWEGEEEETPVVVETKAPSVLVPVPRVTIYPGDMITADMLVDRDFGAEGLAVPQVFTVREGLIGKVSKQTLLPKQPVAPSAVREPFAVKQGQPAVAVFRSGALVISTNAVPLEAGSVGDTISLRNSESGTTIRGVVQADGTVLVGVP